MQRYLNASTQLVSHRKYTTRYVAHIQPVLGGKAADAITRGDLLRLYLDKQREVVRRGERRRAEGETYSKAFCKSLLDIIGAAYGRELAGENPQVRRNPMAGLYKANPQLAYLANEKERTFTACEAAAILRTAHGNGNGNGDLIAWRFALLAIATGARRGALLRLKRRDIDLAAGTIRLIDEKAESTDAKACAYAIPFASFASAQLADHLAALGSEDLVVWGNYLSPQSGEVPTAQVINHRVQPIIDAVVEGNAAVRGNARLTLHTFRSFAITALLDCGCPEFLARRFSNHSTKRRGSFDRYVKATIEQMRPHIERATAMFREVYEMG
ncbi:hypothetical protein FACS1894103_0620 [Campylobacterota bacterium]|nr:hypothetical protein FACS1894103_0490 [Campylobacterota bacterium]GHV58699.1 hypothetical protein FACS1894103_0620 [Campylobacterota bacterium]